MNTRVVIGIIALIAVMAANFAHMQCIALMADQLNRERPEKGFRWPFVPQVMFSEERIIAREYREVHPDGKLYDYWVITIILGALGMIAFFFLVMSSAVAW